MKIRQAEVFLKKLEEGQEFMCRSTGATIYRLESKHDTHCLIVRISNGNASFENLNTPVLPIKEY
jgi:hypothetical protein